MKMPLVRPVEKFVGSDGKLHRIQKWFGRRQWKLEEPFEYTLPGDGEFIVIPAGFTFDFASVPRLFWPVLHPVGLLLIGSIIHDYAYRYHYLKTTMGIKMRLDRKQADRLLLEITKAETGIRIGSCLAWASVRIGGRGSWSKKSQ